jgi:hypothetical protein
MGLHTNPRVCGVIRGNAMHFLFLILFMLLATASFAQSTNDREKNVPTSLHPAAGAPSIAPDRMNSGMKPLMNRRSKIRDGSHIETYEEYVARMKRTVKMIRKNERLMKKPQYSNPMYFGHKHLPKKHKPAKMRFCTECGIRH